MKTKMFLFLFCFSRSVLAGGLDLDSLEAMFKDYRVPTAAQFQAAADGINKTTIDESIAASEIDKAALLANKISVMEKAYHDLGASYPLTSRYVRSLIDHLRPALIIHFESEAKSAHENIGYIKSELEKFVQLIPILSKLEIEERWGSKRGQYESYIGWIRKILTATDSIVPDLLTIRTGDGLNYSHFGFNYSENPFNKEQFFALNLPVTFKIDVGKSCPFGTSEAFFPVFYFSDKVLPEGFHIGRDAKTIEYLVRTENFNQTCERKSGKPDVVFDFYKGNIKARYKLTREYVGYPYFGWVEGYHFLPEAEATDRLKKAN